MLPMICIRPPGTSDIRYIMLPMICIRPPGTSDIRYFQIKIFLLPYVHCRLLSQQNFMFPAKRTCHTNFKQNTTKKGRFRGDFCLCVENVIHVLDPCFSDEAMVLEDSSHIRYRRSYLAKQVLLLTLH